MTASCATSDKSLNLSVPHILLCKTGRTASAFPQVGPASLERLHPWSEVGWGIWLLSDPLPDLAALGLPPPSLPGRPHLLHYDDGLLRVAVCDDLEHVPAAAALLPEVVSHVCVFAHV